MTGSMIVKPARPGVSIPWPRPESHRVLKVEGERVPFCPYWRRLVRKGEVLVLPHLPGEHAPAAKVKE